MKSYELLLRALVFIIPIASTLADDRTKKTGTVDSDASFHVFCEYGVKGEYTRRPSDYAENGDLCKITYPIATKDGVEAERFCKVALPYVVHSFEFGVKTTCTAESLIVCPPGYQQIDGQCFMLTDKHEHHTYEDAVKVCKGKGATVARLSKTKTAAYWTYFWPELSMVWVDVTDDIAAYSVLSEGEKYAVLFSSALHFRRRRNSLVQIDGNERGLVMCEKEHRKTGAYVIRKMRKYEEIYYGNVLGGPIGYYRTSNRYGRTFGKELENNEVCRKVAKPFAYQTEKAYFPVDTLDVKNLFGENLIVARSAMTLHEPLWVRVMSACSNLPYSKQHTYVYDENSTLSYKLEFEPNYYDPCDAQWSLGYIRVNDTMANKRASDAMRAPFLCQTYLSLFRYDACVFNEFAYIRPSGNIVCHRFYDGAMTWDDAQKECQTSNSYLSGFTSDDEKKFLQTLTDKDVWLGAKRKQECIWGRRRNGHGWEDTGSCKKDTVFEWFNSVAPNGKASIIGNYWDKNEPNLQELDEECLHLTTWTPSRPLNDLACSKKMRFLCQRTADFRMNYYYTG